MKKFFSNLISPTPKGWAKLRNVAILAVTLSVLAKATPASVLVIPVTVLKIANIVVWVGSALGITAQSQKKEVAETTKDEI
jgi:hypothetical protein